MDIFDILYEYMDDIDNGVGIDYINSYHGEIVDEYYDGEFTVEVYADGFQVMYCDRD